MCLQKEISNKHKVTNQMLCLAKAKKIDMNGAIMTL
jgi:hypothetical protein